MSRFGSRMVSSTGSVGAGNDEMTMDVDDVIDDAKTHSGEILRCRGLLLKKGGGTSLFGRRKWQDRFVDLDPVMGTITYYSDKERRHKKGSLKVGAATRVSDDASGKHFKGRAKDAVQETRR